MQQLALRSLLGMIALVGGAVSLLSLFVTNPTQLGPFGVTLWFIILAAALSSALSLGFFWVASKIKTDPTVQPKLSSAWRRGILLGGWASVLLGLSSLGQLSPKDIILTGLLVLLIEFYADTRK
jgi:hypothetical protein